MRINALVDYVLEVDCTSLRIASGIPITDDERARPIGRVHHANDPIIGAQNVPFRDCTGLWVDIVLDSDMLRREDGVLRNSDGQPRAQEKLPDCGERKKRDRRDQVGAPHSVV
jgi:hypothetical protein